MPTPTVHSNAFNFLSAVQTGVDPRTGQYSCAITLPELKANQLCGPIVPLSLDFNPMSPRDTGFGKGWSLRLSHFDTVSRILSLSTGETFRIQEANGQLIVPERKIDSFHFSFESASRYRVVHKSGLVETLTVHPGDTLAWVTQVHSAEGHQVTLRYAPYAGEYRLTGVSDEYGVLLDITRPTSSQVNVDLHPGQGPGGAPLARFELLLDNGEVTRIVLPTDEQAGWNLRYDPIHEYLCIVELRNPLGGVEVITYDPQGHEFPQNRYPSLPRVQVHEQRPGFGQPPVQVHYSYSAENFLGFNANGLIWDDDGLDNLYQADSRYTYQSTEHLMVDNKALRTTVRTFNHFHLLTEETVTQGDNVLSTRTAYHGTPGLPFDQQPPQCQLPREVLKLWYHPSASTQTHEEITRTTFDAFGNLLTQENPDGTLETRRYYPAAGEDGCPPDPQGFVRTLKDSTVTPAPGASGNAPVLRTAYRYALQAGVGGATPGWLAMSDERLLQVENGTETELQHTAFTYINQPSDRYLHGRKLKETLTLNGLSTITDYSYRTARNARAGETVQHTEMTLSTSFDDVRKAWTLQHSLLNGQPLLNRDDSDVEIAYRYDALGRVLEETAAPGTPYEASRRYAYVLSAGGTQQAEQQVTDVKGVSTRTLLDGLNRVVGELRQGADEHHPAEYVQTYRAQYDSRGLLVEDTESDWWLEAVEGQPEPQLRELPLTRTYTYDDWGEQSSVTGPDGIERHTVKDPIRQTTRDWVQSSDQPPLISNQTKTKSNRFGKPEWTQTLDAAGGIVGQTDFIYDGLGRCTQQIDPLRQSTSFSYDARSRLISTTLPDQTVVEKDYAPHSSDALPAHLYVKAANATDPLLLGEQGFDGLDRATHVKVGPRTTTFIYKAGQMPVDRCITAGNHALSYEYQLGLTDEPVRILTEDEQADFTYDFENAVLLSSQNARSRTEFDYNLIGQLVSERRVEDGMTWETRHTASLGGRALSREAPGGLETFHEYDIHGRLESITQGQLRAEFAWSSLGRVERIVTTDMATGASVQTGLRYDDQGQETERTLELSGHPGRTITQTWRKDGKLATRHLHSPGHSLLEETFDYDARGRLVLHTCSGETLPRDRYGRGIREQHFDFDALDNITRSHSVFEDGTIDDASFSFADDDPTQLVDVTHTHPDYPASVTLDYDADGNLLHDDAGQRLVYDTQSRLLSVTATDASVTAQYRYDSHNHLVGLIQGSQSETLRFYQDQRLSSSIQDNETTDYLYGAGQPLGQQTQSQPDETLLFMSDAKRSVIGESRQADLRTAVYNAYGERSGDDELRSLLGFNGEVRDRVSGWYLLGRGYRAYNPTLMRFHSPDSLSPFGAGGLNPYVYCLGDPVGLVDPTGHMSFTDAMGLNIAGLVLTLGAIALTIASGGLAAVLTVPGIIAAGTGVASGVTGVIGVATPDLQAKKTLGQISLTLGIASFLAGLSPLATGASKWFTRGVATATDDLADSTPTIQASVSKATQTERAMGDSYAFSTQQYRYNESLDDLDLDLFAPGKADASTQTRMSIPRSRLRPGHGNEINPAAVSPPPPPPSPPSSASLPASLRAHGPDVVNETVTSVSTPARGTVLNSDTEFLEMINKTQGYASLSGKTHEPGKVRDALKRIRR